MQLLCLGDVALANKPLAPTTWAPPGDFTPGPDARVIFNWEFPIGDTINSGPRVSGMRFLAYPDSIRMVENWAPGIATIANNHILDAGEKGLAHTINSLQQAGFETVGAGLTAEEIVRPLCWETSEGRLAIVNWVFAETHPDWMAVPGPNCWPGFTEARHVIQTLRCSSDWVLVVVHWSDELFPYPLPQDRETAGELANMGADIVIGHHPHVVRGMEVLGGCPVFYSIGNFYFAEKRNSEGNWILQEAPRNREGLGVRFTFLRGQDPQYVLLSFWNDKLEAVPDLAHRASRRMQSASLPLRKHHGAPYIYWYKTQRARFDRWDSRWHFGLLKRGIFGTLRRIVAKFRKLSLASHL